MTLWAAVTRMLRAWRKPPAPLPADPPRPDALPMEVFYDAPRDTLYISLGGPRAAIGCELVGNLLIRYVPQTKEIVGLTILDLSTFAARPTLLPVLLTMGIADEGTRHEDTIRKDDDRVRDEHEDKFRIECREKAGGNACALADLAERANAKGDPGGAVPAVCTGRTPLNADRGNAEHAADQNGRAGQPL